MKTCQNNQKMAVWEQYHPLMENFRNSINCSIYVAFENQRKTIFWQCFRAYKMDRSLEFGRTISSVFLCELRCRDKHVTLHNWLLVTHVPLTHHYTRRFLDVNWVKSPSDITDIPQPQHSRLDEIFPTATYQLLLVLAGWLLMQCCRRQTEFCYSLCSAQPRRM